MCALTPLGCYSNLLLFIIKWNSETNIKDINLYHGHNWPWHTLPTSTPRMESTGHFNPLAPPLSLLRALVSCVQSPPGNAMIHCGHLTVNPRLEPNALLHWTSDHNIDKVPLTTCLCLWLWTWELLFIFSPTAVSCDYNVGFLSKVIWQT